MVFQNEEYEMSAFKGLLTSDVGLMSLAVLLFMFGMGGFYVRYFLRHMREDERRARGQH
ncbi:DUF3149 domain-containing protein [Roseateles saccharophilus]|uniref:Uncharacterized protein DUF3149 n=1 Tax=Roseateles saccharophilus TaxID=304 RepID=A0A4R3VI98_ROSSA|nr:uncharacterized protein DUF3149 [Roseateles saccharophilus]